MTKSAFTEAALAGKGEADEFVATKLMGWYFCATPYTDWPWRRDSKGKKEGGQSVPPYATCPDDDPRSWALVGEMWGAWPGGPYWVHALRQYFDREGKPVSWESNGTECVPRRVLAVALALCEAREAFED